MTIWPRLQNVFRNLFHRRQSELDLDDELESLVAHIAEENIRRGMNPQDAIRNARLRIGGIEQLKEEVRTVRSGNFLESVSARYSIWISPAAKKSILRPRRDLHSRHRHRREHRNLYGGSRGSSESAPLSKF